jgi:hypothetical protein
MLSSWATSSPGKLQSIQNGMDPQAEGLKYVQQIPETYPNKVRCSVENGGVPSILYTAKHRTGSETDQFRWDQ